MAQRHESNDGLLKATDLMPIDASLRHLFCKLIDAAMIESNSLRASFLDIKDELANSLFVRLAKGPDGGGCSTDGQLHQMQSVSSSMMNVAWFE